MNKLSLLLVVVSCIAFAGATGAAINGGLFARDSKPVDRSDRPSHGTHLCSAHSHCGSGHLCCSGHCQWVDTCG